MAEKESKLAKPEEPAKSLGAEKPAEVPPKRRGRPPGSGGQRNRKSQQGDPEVLFLVETEEGSGQFMAQEIVTTTELLDIIDMNRQVIATRTWRRF